MKFLLREWRMEDMDSLCRYADNPAVARNLRDSFPNPYRLEDAQAFIVSCLDPTDTQPKYIRAIVVGGEAVGCVSILPESDIYCKTAELGYFLGEPFWGKGIMSAVVKRACAEAFPMFGLVRIFAEPFASNAGSRRVLEKAGFQLEGILKKNVCKNGQILDSCVYAWFGGKSVGFR